MAITSQTNRIQYTLTSTGQTLSFPYKFFNDTDLRVIRRRANADTTLTLNDDYTVTGAGSDSGGTVVLNGESDAVSDVITIIRDVPATQTNDYEDTGPLPIEQVEDALDKLTALVQDLQEQVDRSLKVPTADTGADVTVSITTLRANKRLAFDASGDVSLVDTDIGTIDGDISVVSTVATLQALALTSLTTGSLAYVRGYYGDNDGGEGWFWLDKDTGSTGDANEGTIVSTPDADSYWRRLVPDGKYYADYFGARRNQSAVDNSIAINACLTAHGVCYLRSGTYWTDGEILLTDGARLIGEGMYETTLRLFNDSTTINTSGFAQAGFRMVKNEDADSADNDNILVEGIHFNLNGNNNKTLTISGGAWDGESVEMVALIAVTLRGIQNVIRNCRASGFRGGVSVSGGTGREAFVFYTSASSNRNAYGNLIENCGCHDNASQSQSGTLNRETTLFTCGTGGQTASGFPITGRGNGIRNCWAKDIHYLPEYTAWTSSSTKDAGDFYTSGGSVYRCNTTHTSGATFAGDIANFDLVGTTAQWAQKSPVNMFTCNGVQTEISGCWADNVDGAFFYFDTADLVGLRVHGCRAYNISSVFKCNVNGSSQTDRVEDLEFFDNEFRLGVYVCPRDYAAGASVLQLIQLNVNAQPAAGTDVTRVRFHDNVFIAHTSATYAESTGIGKIVASTANWAYVDTFEVFDNQFVKEDDTVDFQVCLSSSDKSNDGGIQWWENRDQNGDLVEFDFCNVSASPDKIGRWPSKGRTYHAKGVILTEPNILIEDHFLSVPTASNTGKYGWLLASAGSGAAAAVAAHSAGHPGILNLDPGDATGASKYVSIYLPGKAHLDDHDNWRLRIVARFNTDPGTLAQNLVFGLVNNSDPTINISGTPTPSSISSGVAMVLGLGDSNPTYFSRLYAENAGGEEWQSLASTGQSDTNWHTWEITIKDATTSPRLAFWVDDTLAIDDVSITRWPANIDLFPVIGFGQYSSVAANPGPTADIDSILIQAY